MRIKHRSELKMSQKIYLPFKRAIDIFGSLMGIIILSPILLFCIFMTKITSKGPVFFKQGRTGQHKKTFKFIKFRSMRTDAPLIPPDEMSEEYQQSLVTKWGKFMRKTSLDELPQLFLILKGDMSFIGPRPSMPEDKEAELVHLRESYIPSAYKVKPGLSGYAQIHLKRSHNANDKARDDCRYVKNFSFWLDTKIFIYTIFMVLGIAKGR